MNNVIKTNWTEHIFQFSFFFGLFQFLIFQVKMVNHYRVPQISQDTDYKFQENTLFGIKKNYIIWTNSFVLFATRFTYYSVHIIKIFYFL